MIININSAQSEDRRSSASDQDHGHNEYYDMRWFVWARVSALAIVRLGHRWVDKVTAERKFIHFDPKRTWVQNVREEECFKFTQNVDRIQGRAESCFID